MTPNVFLYFLQDMYCSSRRSYFLSEVQFLQVEKQIYHSRE